jgi:hypothetical protein
MALSRDGLKWERVGRGPVLELGKVFDRCGLYVAPAPVPVEGKPGEFRSSQPLPITAPWKTLVHLQRNDEMMAAPVFMPADPGVGLELIPAVDRSVDFALNTEYLLPETRPGDPAVKSAAYFAVFFAIAVWVAMTIRTASRIPGLAKKVLERQGGTPPQAPARQVRSTYNPYRSPVGRR